MYLSDEQVKAFHEKGFIVLKGFFPRETMGKVSGWLDELSAKQPEDEAEAKYYEISPVTGQGMLVRVENVLGPQNPDITDMLLMPQTLECLTQLFGEAPVLFKEKINYKLPGCRADKLHQDQAAGWNTYADFFISMCIVVDPNRKENAALSFMSSGNYQKSLMTEEWQPLTHDDPPFKPEDEYMLIEADPGDVVFFDSYVPHGSPPNTSDKPRRNIYLTFNKQSDGELRDRYYHDKWKNYPPNLPAESRTDSSYRV